MARAKEDALAWLATIDRAEIRRGALLGLAGVIVLNLLLVVAAFIAWIVWAGYL